MSGVVAFVRRCIAAGMDHETALLAAEQFEVGVEAEIARALESRRSSDRERQRRHRASKDNVSHVTARDERDTPSEQKGSPKPLLKTQPSPASFAPKGAHGSAPSDFAAFWQAYPSKVGKRVAETAYRRARGRADAAAILAGVARAKLGRKWREGIIPNPATWLNGDRWLDEEAGAHIEPPTAPADWPETRWRAAVEHFAESRRWSDACGPSPAEPRCRAPPNVLAEFGFAPLEVGADPIPFRASAA